MITFLFGPSRYKVRFLDKNSEIKGFGILLRSGGGKYFADNMWGFNSEKQLGLLKQARVKFELLEPKEQNEIKTIY